MKTKVKVIYLLHPVVEVPSVGRRIGHYYDGIKVIGYKLEFPDGHTACLTYEEIGDLMARHEAYEHNQVRERAAADLAATQLFGG